jgi:hypothetical protein
VSVFGNPSRRLGGLFRNCVELEKIRNMDVFTVDTTINHVGLACRRVP